jgi:hypothetical protein
MRASLLLCLAVFAVSACDCGKGRIVGANGGGVRVKLIGVEPEAVTLRLALVGPASTTDKDAFIATVPLTVLVDSLMPATYVLRASSVGSQGAVLQTVEQPNVMVSTGGVTEVTIDLSKPMVILPPESCNGLDDDGDEQIDEELDLPVCVVCTAGQMTAALDDARCGAIACDGLDHVDVHGDPTAAGTATCEIGRAHV